MPFPPVSTFLRALVLVGCLAQGAGAGAAPTDAARWRDVSATLFTNHVVPVASSGNVIAQDTAGFLWIGTQAGLVRWDGYEFHRYAADPKVPGTLPDSYINALHVDSRGRLWVGTSAGGLARFDAARDAFVVVPTGAAGLKSTEIRGIVADGQGGLWVGGNGGLEHIGADDKVQTSPADSGDALGQAAGGLASLVRARDGTLWMSTRKGLFRRPAQASAFVEQRLPVPGAKAVNVGVLFEDQSGQIWAGTRGHGAFVVDPHTGTARAVNASTADSEISHDSVLAIAEAVPGEIWLGVNGRGIVAVAADGSTRAIRREAGLAQSLGDDNVTALFRDGSGLLWVASSTALSKHDPRQRSVLTLHSNPSRPATLSDPNVSSLLARPDGSVWASAGTVGIDILDPLRGRIRTLRADGSHHLTALPNERVLSMAPARDGGVWIGTGSGLYAANADGSRVRRVDIPGRDPAATVWTVRQDPQDGVLWAGGSDGLWVIDASAIDRLQVLRHVGAAAFGDARVVALQRGSGSDLWVGTVHGLARFDTVTGAVERVPSSADDPGGVPLGWLTSMVVDARGRLWASSMSNAVVRLEGRDSQGRLQFRQLGVRDGLPDASIDMLLADGRGRIWASTDDGLAVIDPDTLAVRTLRRPEGVDLLAYWAGSGTVTPEGEPIFGGQDGISIVRPDEPAVPPMLAPVVITEASIGTTGLPAGRFQASLGPVAPLTVPPDAKSFWVDFASLDFSAPEKNRYAYRLRGFDTDWVATDPGHRRASYTNLPPGDYTLELLGSNHDGVWSMPLALPVRVQPAWFQTWWFRGLVGLAALCAIGGLVHGRTVYLKRRQRALEALVLQRTHDLQLRSEELRASQLQLEKIAYADALTGLPNRRLFSDELRHQVAQAQREGPPFILLLIDLDGFKAINDVHGHDAGDALLVAVAARLLGAVREADRVARLGGDEFAVLLSHDPAPADVDAVCQRIVASVADSVSVNGVELRVGASIGVAACPLHAVDPERLYKAADLALYAAKRGGRNTWRWHSGSVTAPLRLEPQASATASDSSGETPNVVRTTELSR